MESRRSSDLSLPYRKVALWGIAVSVVVTGAFLAASPCSPVQLAEKVLDGRDVVRGAVFLDGRHLPTAAEMSRRAVGEVLGRRGGDGHGAGTADGPAWLRVVPELSSELSREWGRLVPELRAEIAREWTKIAPELREEMRREVRRELRGLRVGIDASPSGVWLDGG